MYIQIHGNEDDCSASLVISGSRPVIRPYAFALSFKSKRIYNWIPFVSAQATMFMSTAGKVILKACGRRGARTKNEALDQLRPYID